MNTPELDELCSNLTTTGGSAARLTDMMARASSSPGPSDSPFHLTAQDVEHLAQSTGFTYLSQHLAEHYSADLCHEHDTTHHQSLPDSILIRDLLHALLVPVVELFDQTFAIASLVLQITRLAAAEDVFTGQARSAFTWLQRCLRDQEERKRCYTQGCPVCVSQHALDTESAIRLLFAACLVSDVHYPFTLDGPTLPSFMFFVEPLEKAVARDRRWGAEFLAATQPRAMELRDGIEELVHQCVDLDKLRRQQAQYCHCCTVPSKPQRVATQPLAHSTDGTVDTTAGYGQAQTAPDSGLNMQMQSLDAVVNKAMSEVKIQEVDSDG